MRGGWWDGLSEFVRVSNSDGGVPGDPGYTVGFRCAGN